MKANSIPTQSFSDRQPRAIAKVIAVCVALVIIMALGCFAYLRHTKLNVSTESVTIDDAEIAKGISEEVMQYVNDQLKTYTDSDGNQITLDDEEFSALQTLVTSEILSLLEGTDLLSLSDTQMQSLVNSIKKNVIDNVLKQSDISQYFTEEDYENIAKYITETATGDLGSLQKQITDNKAAGEAKDLSQDNDIAALNTAIKDVSATVTNNSGTSTSALSDLNDDITNINASINDTNNNLTTAKEQLTSLIEENAALDAETKTALLQIINDNDVKTQEDLTNLTNSLTEYINTLTTAQVAQLEFSADINWNSDTATVTISDASIHTYSNINIIYSSSCTSGYTVKYTQNEGSLVCELTKNAEGTAPSSLSGTLYVDNAVANAQ